METQTTTQTLSFYTDGEGFTELLRSFIMEGRNETVLEILRDGGITMTMIKDFFDGGLKFEGTTQNGKDLSIVEDTNQESLIEQSIISLISNLKIDIEKSEDLLKIDNKDIRALIKIYGKKTLEKMIFPKNLNLINKQILRREGFKCVDFKDLNENIKFDTGVILPSGDLIICGYMGHRDLYTQLHNLGIIYEPDWIECKETLHISSGEISGPVSYTLTNIENEEPNILEILFDKKKTKKEKKGSVTENQLTALFILRNTIRGQYAKSRSLTEALRIRNEREENFGGKYNNLMFIQKYYGNLVKTPLVSKEKLEIPYCLRTSPKHSLPGLLESKFNPTKDSVSEIEETFEKYRNVIENNELNYFYQEYLEGVNGVINCDFKNIKFDISNKRGDIVKGIKGNYKPTKKEEKSILEIGGLFYKDLKRPIQIEFVISKGEVYVVQLRPLENSPETTVIWEPPQDAWIVGKSFSKGNVECQLSEILILDSDGESELLLNKKALIIKENVEFSHILALSRALRIPSIFGVGNLVIPKEDIKIKFNSSFEKGYIKII